MMIASEIVFCFVKAENAICLVWSRGSEGNGPQPIVDASAGDDDLVVFVNLHVVPVEDGSAVVVTELGKRDEGACFQIIQHKGRLCCGREVR